MQAKLLVFELEADKWVGWKAIVYADSETGLNKFRSQKWEGILIHQ